MAKRLQDLDLTPIIKKSITRQLLIQLAEEAIEQIQRRTRLGYGVSDEGKPQEKLKKLEDSTRKTRKRLNARGKLSDKTTPARSNLTMTGELLDSLSYSISGQTITIEIKGTRNQQVASYVSKVRPFFNLSKTEQAQLVDLIRSAVKRQLISKGN